MILVDSREGSKQLQPLLRDSKLTRLEFADFAFTGSDRDGRISQIGIEYKTLPDVLSCIADGRFAGHQLPGMMKAYDHFSRS